jgi:predicted aspartyl protease
VVGYSCVHHYSSQKPGITLPVTLCSGAQRSTVPASVDTGASHCLFARAHAEALGLSVEDGERLIFSTANGRFEAFGHELTIDVLGIETNAVVFFFADPNITRNVLGRQGWLDRVRLGLIDHDQEALSGGIR